VLRQAAILSQPFMPAASARMLDQLGIGEARDFSQLGERGRLVPGTAIPKPEPVFPRYVDESEETAIARC
jgi:methionyl-tRNA synthetase